MNTDRQTRQPENDEAETHILTQKDAHTIKCRVVRSHSVMSDSLGPHGL